MPTVIGRVTRDSDRPRGPDARLDVRVPEDWLRAGATLEIELPRNLTCAACDGGGCDGCNRSGAVTLRGRGEPPELVEVTLPRLEEDRETDARGAFLLRIPDYGGLPEPGAEMPRGNLLLRVRLGSEPDAGVARIRHSYVPSAAPPPLSVPIMSSVVPPEAAPAWKLMLLAATALAVLYAFVRVLTD